MSVDKLASELETILTRRIEADQLVLPTMPAVALQVQAILDDEEAGMKEVAVALQKDPVLAARVLKMATSAVFASAGKKPTLDAALARLGAKVIKALLVEAAAQRLFVSRNAQINGQLHLLWEHSVAVGMLAREALSRGRRPRRRGRLPGRAAPRRGQAGGGHHPARAGAPAHRRLPAQLDRLRRVAGGGGPGPPAGRRRPGRALGPARSPSPPASRRTPTSPTRRPAPPTPSASPTRSPSGPGSTPGGVDDAEVGARIDEGVAVLGLPDGSLRKLTEGLRERASSLFE